MKKIKKGVKVILAGSIVCMGTFTYIPNTKAMTIPPVIQGANTSPTLTTLEIEGVPFDEVFSSDVQTYHATVGKDVEKIRLLTESASGTVIIKANDTQLTSGKSKDFTLQGGTNTFIITVSDGTSEPTTYKVLIEKQESDDNLLTGIGLSEGSLSFDPSLSSYTVPVSNKVNTITVTPKWSDHRATVEVNGVDSTSKGVKLILPVDKTKVKILVTAENGDKKVYVLTIIRAAATTTGPEKDPYTDDPVVPDKIEKEPTKDTTKTQPSSGNKGSEKPSSTPVNSTEGKMPTNGLQAPNIQHVTSGSASEGMVEKLTKEDEEVSHAPKLNTLTASSGTWNQSFDPDQYTYHIKLEKDITSVQIGAKASESGVTIKYEGEGNNTVTIRNKAKTSISVSVSKEGDRRTYVLVFEKNIDVEMDEEETVDDVKTNNETDLEAKDISASSKMKSDQPDTKKSQMRGNGATESSSLWGEIKKFFNAIF